MGHPDLEMAGCALGTALVLSLMVLMPLLVLLLAIKLLFF